jgi:hypothetical protein
LGGTAASWLDVGVFVGLFDVVIGVDDDTAGASLVGGIIQVGTAALVVSAGLALERYGVWDGEVGAADVVGGVKQAGTAARQAVGIGKNSSVTADAGEGVVGSVVTALAVDDAGDISVVFGYVAEDGAVVYVGSDLDEVVGVEGAASLGSWVEGL